VTDLIFDTETTGFPRWSLPKDSYLQPHLVELSLLLVKGEEIIDSLSTLVQCPIEIPQAAAKVHGITKEQTTEKGMDRREVLGVFQTFLQKTNRLVAHNIKFDLFIMEILYAREKSNVITMNSLPLVCTMLSASKEMSKATEEGFGQSKWPKLQEAYQRFVSGEGFEGAHRAEADTIACHKLLVALEKKGAELVA